MGLFHLFKKKEPEQAAVQERLEDYAYSGMRVEVATLEGDLLFAAKLMSPRDTSADLYQFSTAAVSSVPEEPVRVQIRGYNDDERKAVYMEGVISPQPNHIWQVEELTVSKMKNDRAFFRLGTNLDAEFTPFGGGLGEERPCKLLNISVGGAQIGTDYLFYREERFRLKVKLMEDQDPIYLFCEVLRIMERESGSFEYGCRFLNLSETDQDRITENIFAAQLKKGQRK